MKRLWMALAGLLLVLTRAGVRRARRRLGPTARTGRSPTTGRSATVDAHGTTAVQLTLDFDFGNEAGHGPYLTFPLRQEIADDPDHWRMIDMTIGQVSQPERRERRGADRGARTATCWCGWAARTGPSPGCRPTR